MDRASVSVSRKSHLTRLCTRRVVTHTGSAGIEVTFSVPPSMCELRNGNVVAIQGEKGIRKESW